MKTPVIQLGRVVATPGALATLGRADMTPDALLARYVTGDWGDMSEHDRRVNDRAAQLPERVLANYDLPGGEKVWVITEADRSVTTILRPDEY